MSTWEDAAWLRLEARLAEDAEERNAEPGEAGSTADTGGDRMRPEAPIRILIVEDSQPVRRQLRRLIERQLPGVVVEEAEDGCEAVEKITQQSPDIAILDIAMPVLNGLLAIEKIAAIDSELPVIVHSLYATPQMEGEVRKRGARVVVPKDDVRGLLSVLGQLSQDQIGTNPG